MLFRRPLYSKIISSGVGACFSFPAAAEYERHAWLERIGHGAFIKAGDQVGWQGALYAIQRHLQLSIHAGGKTALSLHGHVRFVSIGTGNPIYLFSPPQLKFPQWFKKSK